MRFGSTRGMCGTSRGSDDPLSHLRRRHRRCLLRPVSGAAGVGYRTRVDVSARELRAADSGRRALMALTKRLRFEILRRDNHLCRYCGATAPDVKLTVDHVVPTALGGSDEPSNLVTACADCNSGKSATPPDASHVADVAQDALRWAAAMAEVARIRQAKHDDRVELHGWFNSVWTDWTDWRGEVYPVSSDWIDSVAKFIDAGVSHAEIEDLVGVAMRMKTVREKWRYFCGCCHTRIKQNVEMAARIIAQEEAVNGP
ncbi:HNH endonuclease [Rhodococcus fascians]|nr:HNH endonuclease [Rhodococcus fascians]MBY4396910.1 HNH endonuclease [Rhodococcus fascians]MBY4407389.1 HNH endonuclease [Rhodococcus fascians]MBY4421482.1 HNH endonuclease [Rhodococcus fascians]MBY4460765.1 HNH endonuclease [Rhodococcus fascians]